jgi:8-oxo-dGTP pyrophosphatase MutT (NUDIX family)
MKIEAYGIVIIHDNKLLVSKDDKDDFYKIPGGKPNENETGKETAIRELQEETGLTGIIEKKLSSQILTKNETTGEKQEIALHHYKGKLKNYPNSFKTYIHNGHEVAWIDLNNIDKYNIAPNIKFSTADNLPDFIFSTFSNKFILTLLCLIKI